MKKTFALALAVLMSGALAGARAQAVPALENIKNDEQLTQAIKTLDAELFQAYNTCDLEKFGALIDENVEFYHDRGGLMLGRKAVVDGVKNNICGRRRGSWCRGRWRFIRSATMGRWRLGCTGFCIRGRKTMVWLGRRSLFICGSTRMERGGLRG
jgi:hypothetical protein